MATLGPPHQRWGVSPHSQHGTCLPFLFCAPTLQHLPSPRNFAACLVYHPKHTFISGHWLMPVLGATSSCPSSLPCYDQGWCGKSWLLLKACFLVTLHFQRLLACSYHESCPWQCLSFLCKKNIPGPKLYKCHMGFRHFFPHSLVSVSWSFLSTGWESRSSLCLFGSRISSRGTFHFRNRSSLLRLLLESWERLSTDVWRGGQPSKYLALSLSTKLGVRRVFMSQKETGHWPFHLTFCCEGSEPLVFQCTIKRAAKKSPNC